MYITENSEKILNHQSIRSLNCYLGCSVDYTEFCGSKPLIEVGVLVLGQCLHGYNQCPKHHRHLVGELVLRQRLHGYNQCLRLSDNVIF